MKRAIAIALIAVAGSVHAGEKVDWRTACKTSEELARTIMTARQKGIAMSKMMDLAGDNQLAQTLVTTAYDKLQYNTEKYQQLSINEFANETYLLCVQTLRK